MTSFDAVQNGTKDLRHDEAIEYAWHVVHEIDALLAQPLHAAYVIGSLAFGDYAPGVSDIDLALVSRQPVGEDEREQVAEALEPVLRQCPARGLGLVIYRGPHVPADGLIPFDLDLSGGPELPLTVVTDPAAQPSHWYVIDVSIARRHGLRLSGPEATHVFDEPARGRVLTAIERALWWQGGEATAPANTVLNACRSWLYAAEGIWSSKSEAAVWAQRRVAAGEDGPGASPADSVAIIDAALAARVGRGAAPSTRDMRRFVGWVVQVVDGFSRQEITPAA